MSMLKERRARLWNQWSLFFVGRSSTPAAIKPFQPYDFAGFEQLEERQLLSGTTDDPTNGTGDSAADISGPAGSEQLPESYYGLGEFGNGLSLPQHWQDVLPAGFSWGAANLFTYSPVGTEGSSTYTSFNTDADLEDTDPNSVFVSRYQYTLTVDWEGSHYSETLTGTLSRYVLATDDAAIRDQVFSEGFEPGHYGFIHFESQLNYRFTQQYNQDQLVQVTTNIEETNDTRYAWTALNYHHLEPSDTTTITSDARFQVTGSSHGRNTASFQASLSDAGISFSVEGSGNQQTGARDGSGPANITQTYSGSTTLESGNLDTGGEGRRETLRLNGTIVTTANSSYGFSGNGTISNIDGMNRAQGTIQLSSSGNSTFENNLTSTYDLLEVVHNVEYFGTDEVDGLGGLTSGSGFLINLPDGDTIHNTARSVVHNQTIDRSSGNSQHQANHEVVYRPDGTTTTRPTENTGGGMVIHSEINIDKEIESSLATSIRKEYSSGFSEKTIQLTSESHTTGVQTTNIDNQITETASTAQDDTFSPVRVGFLKSDGTIGLTTEGTSTQAITMESNQHVVLYGGAVLLNPATGSGGSDTGDSSNLSDGDGETPTNPDDVQPSEFNDYRKNVATISLKTLETTQDRIDTLETYENDGDIVILDNSEGSIRIEYLNGSFMETHEKRSHTPTDSLPDGVEIREGVTSSSEETNRKEITGFRSDSYQNDDLTTTLTVIPPTIDSSDSTDGTTATAGDLTGDKAIEYDVAVMGTTIAVSAGNLAGVITGQGESSISHWSNEGEGDQTIHKTIQTSGDWTLTGNSSTSGNRTTTTNYLADGKRDVQYTGDSAEVLSTSKTVNSSSARGESSGQLPVDMLDPHSDTPLSDSDISWVNGHWMADPAIFDFDFNNDNVDNTPVNEERDKYQGTFSFEKSTEVASLNIKTESLSATQYNYHLTLTPKPPVDSGGDDGSEELSEPDVATGSDTTTEIANFRDHFDVQLNGQIHELDLVHIVTTTLSNRVQTIRLSQTDGTHPGSEDDWMSRTANDVLPEWANRHRVRTGEVDTSNTLSAVVKTLVLDNRSTHFADGMAVTTTTGLPPRPTGGDGTDPMGGTGASDGSDDAAPFANLTSKTSVFHDAYDEMVGNQNRAQDEINSRFSDSGDGTSPPGGPGDGDDGTPESEPPAVYSIVSDSKSIDHSQHIQEQVFMDDLDRNQGYYSITDYTMKPADNSSSSEDHDNYRISRRELETTLTIKDYLDRLESGLVTDVSVSSTTDSAATTADSDNSWDAPNDSPGQTIGRLIVQTDSTKATHYQWNQIEKIHAVTWEGVRQMTSQTKHADHSFNREVHHAVLDSTLLSNGNIKFNNKTAELKENRWDVDSKGKAKIRGLIADSNRTFDSRNEGEGWSAESRTTQYEDDGTTNMPVLRTGHKAAYANVEGDINDVTLDIFDPDGGTNENAMATRRTEIHIEETAFGSPVYFMTPGGMFDLIDLDSQIKIQRHTVGTTTYTFTIAEAQTQPIDEAAPEKTWGALIYIGEFKTYTFGNLGDDVQYHAIATTVGTRLMGFVTLVGGVAEVAAGVALTETGLGAPFGVIAIVHGIDTIYAGSTQLLDGGESRTLTAQLGSAAFLQGIAFTGGNEVTAQEQEAAKSFGDAVDVVVGLADMGAGAVKAISKLAKAAKAADTANGVRLAVNGADNLSQTERVRKAMQECAESGGCFVAGVPVATIRPTAAGLWLAERPTLLVPSSQNSNTAPLLSVRYLAIGGIIAATVSIIGRQRSATGSAKHGQPPQTPTAKQPTNEAPDLYAVC